jgi:hypothetical protein
MPELAEVSPAEPERAATAEPARAATARARPRVRPALSAETAAVVRARLGGAIPEMIEVIGRGIPEYASLGRPDYQQRLADAVTAAVAQFIAHIAQPTQSTQAITAEFRAVGCTAAREGRTLNALPDALPSVRGWPGAGCAKPTPGSTGAS